jgi:hypothetical protein
MGGGLGTMARVGGREIERERERERENGRDTSEMRNIRPKWRYGDPIQI